MRHDRRGRERGGLDAAAPERVEGASLIPAGRAGRYGSARLDEAGHRAPLGPIVVLFAGFLVDAVDRDLHVGRGGLDGVEAVRGGQAGQYGGLRARQRSLCGRRGVGRDSG